METDDATPRGGVSVARLRRSATTAVVAGFLLGMVLLAFSGPAGGDHSRRIEVRGADVRRIQAEEGARVGREPTAGELRAAVEGYVRREAWVLEGRRSGRLGDEATLRAAIGSRLELLGHAEASAAPPTDAEVRAFLALRPERYAGMAPSEAYDRAAAELMEEAVRAAVERMEHEVLGRYRIVYDRAARAALAGE